MQLSRWFISFILSEAEFIELIWIRAWLIQVHAIETIIIILSEAPQGTIINQITENSLIISAMKLEQDAVLFGNFISQPCECFIH